MAFLARSRLAIAWATLAAASLASSSSAQVMTYYTYDDQGQVKTVVRSGNTVAYTYDAAGNRTAVGVSYPPPGAAAGSLSVPFGGSASLALPVSGQFTGAAVDTAPVKGSVTIAGTTATYTASGSNYGSDSFTYHAVGPGGNSPVQTIGVTIANPPAPGANNGALNVAYNSAASLAAPVTGVATGLVIDGNPAKGSVTTSGTTFTYTATWPNYGADSFTYHATGPGGASPVRTMSVNIANGAAPAASNGSAATAYNAPVTITYPVGGDYATMALDSVPAHGSLSSLVLTPNVGYQQTYTPQAGWIGADSWTFHATSPFGNSPVRTFTVTTGAPAAPTVSNKTLSVAYGTGGSVSIAPSGLYTSVAILTQPAHGQAGNAGNQTIADYIPAAGYYGPDSFTYNAAGPGGASNTGTVSVSVGLPPAPSVANASLAATYNGSGAIALPVSGVYTNISFPGGSPAHGTLNLTGSTVTYYPTAGYYGADSFTYSATGPGGNSNTGTISVTVGNPPAPTAGNVSATAPRPVAIALTPSGVYGALAVASAPAHGSASISGTTATYAPVIGYSGADSFTYVASGPGGTSAPGTVSITVPLNHAPTAVGDGGVVHSQNTITIAVLANDTDPDGDPLTVTSASSSDGSAYVTGGGTQVGFDAPTVATRANKTVTITYGISDGRGGTASVSFNVTVQTEYYD